MRGSRLCAGPVGSGSVEGVRLSRGRGCGRRGDLFWQRGARYLWSRAGARGWRCYTRLSAFPVRAGWVFGALGVLVILTFHLVNRLSGTAPLRQISQRMPAAPHRLASDALAGLSGLTKVFGVLGKRVCTWGTRGYVVLSGGHCLLYLVGNGVFITNSLFVQRGVMRLCRSEQIPVTVCALAPLWRADSPCMPVVPVLPFSCIDALLVWCL